MEPKKPTIKGIFVNSHINRLTKQQGQEGIKELKKRYNKKLDFKNSDNVPVSEELAIIEHVLDILTKGTVPQDRRSLEAGRLHFKNFTTTPLGGIIFSVFRKNFKLMMLRVKYIAEHVFEGITFSSEDLGPKMVSITVENTAYPLDHFRGVFQEWMEFAGMKGTVEGSETAPNSYKFLIQWE